MRVLEQRPRWFDLAIVLLAAVILFAIPANSQSGFGLLDSIDPNADPCGNFYQYACGGWMAANPLPGDVSRWGRFDELQDRNRELLRSILETAAQAEDRDAVDQKIGDLYASCINPEIYNRRSMDQFQRDLNKIAVLASKEELTELVVYLHRLGAGPFFRLFAVPDFADSSRQMAVLDQGGVALPDIGAYQRDDQASRTLREDYRAHLERMFRLLGSASRDAAADADAVLRIETALAAGSLTPAERRDPQQLYHVMSIDELDAIAMNFDWFWYFSRIGSPSFETLDVAVPTFAEALSAVIEESPLEDLKAYLTWTLAHNLASLLRDDLQQAEFDFFSTRLNGIRQRRARSAYCVNLVNRYLPDALGRKFVDVTLGEDGVVRAREMVERIRAAFARELAELDWMSVETKVQALAKLQAMMAKIGGKETWRTYEDVRIAPDDLYSNVSRAASIALTRDLAKIGQPVDTSEWQMTQPTVDAYNDGQTNSIYFPAGILQPPFWDNNRDDALNYGAIGAFIGHEVTHAFDDQGRQFDADGNLRDWWTAEDAAAFGERAACFEEQYSSFPVLDGINVDGRLTLGENIADNGGVRIAYRAVMDQILAENREQNDIDGLTAEQRFFLGWAQIWCQNMTEESLRIRLATDPHSPAEFRVNGVMQNIPEFREAFGCTEAPADGGFSIGSGPGCRIW